MEQLFTPQFFTQYGLSAIFIYWSWKLYNDQRTDSLAREERLLTHLDKVSDTLTKIDNRLCALERKDDHECD